MDCRGRIVLHVGLGGLAHVVRGNSLTTASRSRGPIGSRNTPKGGTPRLLPRARVEYCVAGFSCGRPVRRAASLLFFAASCCSLESPSQLGAYFRREDDLSCPQCIAFHRAHAGFCLCQCFPITLRLKHGPAKLIRAAFPSPSIVRMLPRRVNSRAAVSLQI